MRALRRRLDEDAGFTLIEVTIAMVIFAMVSMLAAIGLMTNLKTTSQNRARVIAADLALREIETVRSAFLSPVNGPQSVIEGQVVNPLSNGQPGSGPTLVNGREYTVTRDAVWTPQGATSGPCDGGASGPLAYLRVSVAVTWQGMTANEPPVTNSTLLTPPLGTYRGGLGNIKVKVTDAATLPESGTTITLSQGGVQVGFPQNTSSDGCAFFAFLNPGNYTVTASRPNYVGKQDWLASPTYSTSVAPNAVSTVNVGYTPQSTLALAYDTSVPGFPPSPATAITLTSPNLTTTSLYAGWVNTLTVPAATTNVYPWPDASGVVAWAGDCRDSDPALAGGVRQNAYATTAGVTTVTAIGGARVTVNVKKSGTPLAGVAIEASHTAYASGSPATPVCPSGVGGMPDPNGDGTTVGEALLFKNLTDAAGNTSILLPYGTWVFKTVGRTPRTSSSSYTLAANGTYPLVVTMSVP